MAPHPNPHRRGAPGKDLSADRKDAKRKIGQQRARDRAKASPGFARLKAQWDKLLARYNKLEREIRKTDKKKLRDDVASEIGTLMKDTAEFCQALIKVEGKESLPREVLQNAKVPNVGSLIVLFVAIAAMMKKKL